MILARVMDRLVSSEKHPQFEGSKILWVQPLALSGDAAGEPFLAIDTVGAGHQETVLVVKEGGASIIAFRRPFAPLNAAIVGIVDQTDVVEGEARA